ncbi:MAG: aminotransferase class I/II-fold pyridoxal phosphate-dependent enzyme [Clostridia bacterium]|nr:aminotransferase class I/II-fold pyridoxal phosphate-dependent enzyme [Clostridia bacterium]
MNKRIFLASPHMSDEGYEQAYVKEAFDTNWIAPLGENVNKFEEELATYVGIGHAAALSAGTAALHLAIKAAGVKRGDIVFCSSLTFSATVNPAVYEGAIPVFIDSEKDTYNMDPKALEKAFEKYPDTKVVIVVHLYGIAANIEEIARICEKHNAVLIEDAAESLGTTVNGKFTGTFGKFGIFSFNGNKIITTSGGGMLVSEDKDAIAKTRFWATQAREQARHYEHKEIGYNYRMSNVCAGIGRGQLKVLEDRVAKKTEIFNMYKEGFKDIADIQMQTVDNSQRPNYWLSTLLLDENSKVKPLDIIVALEENNIESRPIWKPMHMQPVFADRVLVKAEDDMPAVSEDIFARGVCLPSDTKMTHEEQQLVIDIIKNLWNK